MIRADTAADVVPALLEAEAALRRGHWLAGYAGYEAGYALEPKLAALMPEGRRLPLLQFGVFAGPDREGAARMLAAADANPASPDPVVPLLGAGQYDERFAAAKELIAAGDIYQVNLTMPFAGRYTGDALALFGGLRRKQPVRFGSVVALDDRVTLLSRSPELFFRTEAGGAIETRPMKGTAPRLPEGSADRAQAEGLRLDAKNRAENLMIVDLLRNDLGRICRIGSIRVPELFRIETYATVHQMVSSVQGSLMPGIGLHGLFRALFPCGSVTGAPKIRAMEVIAGLEDQPREAYCGAIGWAAPDGRSCFSVAIRTLHLYAGGELVLNAGGGIVADSQAGLEYEEVLWKTRFAQG